MNLFFNSFCLFVRFAKLCDVLLGNRVVQVVFVSVGLLKNISEIFFRLIVLMAAIKYLIIRN